METWLKRYLLLGENSDFLKQCSDFGEQVFSRINLISKIINFANREQNYRICYNSVPIKEPNKQLNKNLKNIFAEKVFQKN